jgi:hypothetical protein
MNSRQRNTPLDQIVARLDTLEQENAHLQETVALLQGGSAPRGLMEVPGHAAASHALPQQTSRRGMLHAALGIAAATVGAGTLLEARTGTALASGLEGQTTFSSATPAPAATVTINNTSTGMGLSVTNNSSTAAAISAKVAREGDLALRLFSGPNSFLDVTPTNAGGRFQTVLNTLNNRDLGILTGTGNVGIGTTSPSGRLTVDVANEGDLALRLLSGPNSFLDITPTNAGGRFQTVLNTLNNRDLGILTGTGNVGIGTTSPSGRLTVDVANEGDLALRLLSGPNSFLDITPTNVGGRFQTVLNTLNNRDLGILTGTGNVGIGTTSPGATLEVRFGGTTLADAWMVRSSHRWKTHIATIDDAVDKVRQLRGVTFEWRESGRHDIGLIAEEVGHVLPELVRYVSNGTDAIGLDYARIVALLIEATKQQQTQIEEQRVRIAALEGR